jgi:hypothetical protein
MSTVKTIGACLTVGGLILQLVERLKAPQNIITEQSPEYPEWLSWVGWIVVAAGAVILIFA